ncbi:MAG: helix-turn-helix domain-containing protein [Pirellulales bacterium]|nr:helix-turn-helix domain-containing protein [Pirellulales bacterium]
MNTAKKVTPERELLTLKEAAALSGVSDRTLWEWARRGICPAPIRIGRAVVRYSRRAYEEWIAAGCPRVDGGRNDE